MSIYSQAGRLITERDKARGARIKQLMKKQKLRQKHLADATGASKGAVSKWLSGVSVPSYLYLISLAETLKTTSDWILDGDGVPCESTKDQSNTLFQAPIYEDIETMNRQSLIHNGKYAPISTTIPVAAGASIADTYCYINNGDSMSPKISHGAECLVDGSKKRIKEGRTYLIEYGVLLIVRTIFMRHDGGLVLRAANKEYGDEIIEQRNLSQLKILGWVYRVANLDKW